MSPERTSAIEAITPHAPPDRPPTRGEPGRGSDPFGEILDQHQARTADAEGQGKKADRGSQIADRTAPSSEHRAPSTEPEAPSTKHQAPSPDVTVQAAPTPAGASDIDALLAAAGAFTLTAAPVAQAPVAQPPVAALPVVQQPVAGQVQLVVPMPQAPAPQAQGPLAAEAQAPVRAAAVPVAAQAVAQVVPAAAKPAVPADPAAPAAPQAAPDVPAEKPIVALPQQQSGTDTTPNREHAPQPAPALPDAAPKAPAEAPASDPAPAPQAAPAATAPEAAPTPQGAAQPAAQPAPQAPVAPAAQPVAQTAEPQAPAPHQPPAGMRLHQAVETVEAIVRMAQSGGVTRARVALHPEQLGSLEIHLRHTSDGIAARVVADAAQAAHVLRNGGEELRRSLEAQGLNLVSFDVDTAGARDERRSGFGQGDPGSSNGRQDGGPLDAPEATETTEEKTVRLPNGVLVDVLA
jgi:flagellar hook-length control protein FliK